MASICSISTKGRYTLGRKAVGVSFGDRLSCLLYNSPFFGDLRCFSVRLLLRGGESFSLLFISGEFFGLVDLVFRGAVVLFSMKAK